MKIVQIKRLIDNGDFSATKEWEIIEKHIKQAIETVDWPPG